MVGRLTWGIAPFLLLSTLSLVCPTVADPRVCNGAVKSLTASDFTLQEQNNTYLADLSKVFQAAGKVATVSQVLDSANRDLRAGSLSGPDETWLWNSGDYATTKWIPQGMTSTGDALASGTYEGREAWLVSWYQDEGDSRVRVSFVDRATHKYRHVMLVVPTAKDNFEAAISHAGGIAWYGNALYLVETWGGLRVFDLDNIWAVDPGDDVGNTGGVYSAADYAYVLPQSRVYSWDALQPDSKFRHSWVSLDRKDSPDTLLIGEFQTTDVNTPIRLVKYPLDYTTRRLQNEDGVVTATWAYCVDFLKMQGGFSRGNKFYLGRSAGSSGGDLFTWSPGAGSTLHSAFFPPGDEDMSYNEAKKEWYTVTEQVSKRYIVTYKEEVA